MTSNFMYGMPWNRFRRWRDRRRHSPFCSAGGWPCPLHCEHWEGWDSPPHLFERIPGVYKKNSCRWCGLTRYEGRHFPVDS